MANKRKDLIFKINISDPKTGKTYHIDSNSEFFLGKKIGDEIDGSIINLEGYKLKITGGSGFEGAPMREYIEGAVKKYDWIKYKKMRRKILVRGNTISNEIVEINTIITNYGQKPLEEIFGNQENKEENQEQKQ